MNANVTWNDGAPAPQPGMPSYRTAYSTCPPDPRRKAETEGAAEPTGRSAQNGATASAAPKDVFVHDSSSGAPASRSHW